MKYIITLLLLFMLACRQESVTHIPAWVPYDESDELAENAGHQSVRMHYKLIQSKVLDKNDILKSISDQLSGFSEADYEELKPLILEQDITAIQLHIKSGELTYELLTKWYLFRIAKFENDRSTFLNSIIAINPLAVKEARERDKNKSENDHPVYGMPVLLKDNINFEGLATTAGAHAFLDNKTSNAFIVDRITDKGGIILGKANLSEWANYLCFSCPNGYSAVGGQTLSPYGRRIFDTGGSSSGSGTSMAANYAAAAVGTETSGSILSPSSAASIVGLKPTVGLLSRGGIVPISRTLDTPGPMTRNVLDNAILLSAMSGEDSSDLATANNPRGKKYWQDLASAGLSGLRFGVLKNFLRDSLYRINVDKIVSFGGIAVEIESPQIRLDGFGTLLSAEMKTDLPDYIKKYGSPDISFRSVDDIVGYNKIDTLVRIPYGQGIFEEIVSLNISNDELLKLQEDLHKIGVAYFEGPMVEFQLDVILSVNNRSAGYAAAARYPCITVPMGYRGNGEPAGLTFIARPFEEDKLLKIGYAFEKETKSRRLPEMYR